MAEIIVEPTALSKVIALKFKINDVDVPKTTQLPTNKQFNTTDTDAWFTFELDGLASINGTYDLTLINLDDKSIFHHDHVLFPTLPFHYKLNSSEDVTLNEIRHAGRWLGQLVVTLSNGDTTARQFGFDIAGHILDGQDGQDAQVILLSDYQALINTINLAKDDLAQYNVDYAALLVDLAAAETARTATYNQLVADQQANIDAFDVALDDGIAAANLATKLRTFEATNNSRLLSAERQLAEKVGGGVLADMVDLSQNVKTAMTGGSVAVVGINSVDTIHVVDNSISPDKLTSDIIEIKQSINLLDETYSRLGGYYAALSGVWFPLVGLRSTPLIHVKKRRTYTKNSSGNSIVFWDINGSYVSGFDVGPINTFTVPDDERIQFVTYPIEDADGEVMFVEGSTYPETFVPYSKETVLKDKKLEYIEVVPASINILNPERVRDGGYYHFETGIWTPQSSAASTDFAQIKVGEKISSNTGGGQVTFWDENFDFVFGVDIMQTGKFTGPTTAGVKYFRISIWKPNTPINMAIVVRGDTLPDHYVPYSEEKFILPSKHYELESKKNTGSYTTPEIAEHPRVQNPILTKDIVTDRTMNTGGVADPFIVFDKGRYHMFFEILGATHPVSGQVTDEVAHAYSDNLIDWTYTQVVLPHATFGHRSAYPNVFKIDGVWYMLPDTVGHIKLYKATNFPLEWSFVSELLSDTNYADTNVFEIGSVWYMTTSRINPEGANSMQLYYNVSGDWKNSSWTAHPIGNILTESASEKGKRNAGNIFHGGDYIIFPSQVTPVASGIYGEYTDWYKLSNITTATATISKLGRALSPSGIADWKDRAMHHISHVEHDKRNVYAVDGVKDGVYSIGLYTDA